MYSDFFYNIASKSNHNYNIYDGQQAWVKHTSVHDTLTPNHYHC